MELKCGKRVLDVSSPVVMGIVNATPDSFSDGGVYYRNGSLNHDLALKTVEKMVSDGALMIDVGGESTRPGAATVSAQEEMDRVLPLIEAIDQRFDVVVSVDTSSPEVMREAARSGAGFINDVRALTRPGALSVVAESGLPVCLMHMQGQPATMQYQPVYSDVACEVEAFFRERVQVAQNAGIEKNRIVIDPGYGFGKTLEHNLTLLARQNKLEVLGLPLLVGLSRKSMIDHLLGRPVEQRLSASLALAMLAVEGGASIVRVHDVAATVDVLAVIKAVNEFKAL